MPLCVLPYSGKFSRLLIFADWIHSVRLKPPNYNNHGLDLCDHYALRANFGHTTYFPDSWSESKTEIEMALLKYFAPSKTFNANTPVYGCGFTYLGYARKLKRENVQSDQSAKVFTLENFPLYSSILVSWLFMPWDLLAAMKLYRYWFFVDIMAGVSIIKQAASLTSVTSAAAPWLHLLQLLLPNCIRFSCCSPIASVCDHAQAVQSVYIVSTKVAHHYSSPAPLL